MINPYICSIKGTYEIAKPAATIKDEIDQSVRADNEPAPASGQSGFGRFAAGSSQYLGSKWAFLSAIGVILVWGITGPFFHYSDTWQLIINTGTTIVTFLMVFLIQNTQNRDAKAIHLKLKRTDSCGRQSKESNDRCRKPVRSRDRRTEQDLRGDSHQGAGP